MIKKQFFLLLGLSLFLSCTQGTEFLQGITQMDSGALSQAEVVAGLKQALDVGTSKSVTILNQKNGYFNNSFIKIPFPEEALKVESTLRKLGMGKLCDDVVLSLNRAAESAALEAKPIFVNAIKQMSFSDAMTILLGKEHEATDYFQNATTQSLTASFRPVISKHLNQVHATKYWTDVMGRYNQIPFMQKVDTDLTAYVTSKAVAGLFHSVAQEEASIRKNPAERSTQLLQKVFGYADTKKATK